MPELSPRRAAEFLAELPTYPPPRATRLPDGMTLSNVQSGDLIAVHHRWLTILGCTSVNGWVTIRLDDETEAIVATGTTPVHLARREPAHDCSSVAPGVTA